MIAAFSQAHRGHVGRLLPRLRQTQCRGSRGLRRRQGGSVQRYRSGLAMRVGLSRSPWSSSARQSGVAMRCEFWVGHGMFAYLLAVCPDEWYVAAFVVLTPGLRHFRWQHRGQVGRLLPRLRQSQCRGSRCLRRRQGGSSQQMLIRAVLPYGLDFPGARGFQRRGMLALNVRSSESVMGSWLTSCLSPRRDHRGHGAVVPPIGSARAWDFVLPRGLRSGVSHSAEAVVAYDVGKAARRSRG